MGQWLLILFLLWFFLLSYGGRLLAAEDKISADLTALSLEELMQVSITGAAKYRQSESEAPATVTVIKREEIKKYGYRTLADLLRAVPSLYITYDRNYSYLGVRGLNRPGDYGTRILVLIDGHRLNDSLYDQALFGNEFPLDIDLIDRVEVIRGPGSSLYGANALLAVINVITINGKKLNGLEVAGSAGSFETFKGRASLGKSWRPEVEVLLSGTVADSRGPKLHFSEFDSTPSGGYCRNDYENYQQLYSKIKIKDFTLFGLYGSRTKGIPTGVYGTVFNDPGNKTVDTRAYVDLAYDRSFGHQWDFSFRAFYDYYRFDGNYILPPDPAAGYPQAYKNIDYAQAEGWGVATQLTKTFWQKHKVVVGGEYRNSFCLRQENHNESPYLQYLNLRKRTWNLGLFLQDEYTVLPNLRLTVGARYDYYDFYGGSLNPRVALIYQPWQKTTFKLLYGQAFRVPNQYELYYADGYSMKANPHLKAETIRNTELVWEQQIGANHRFATSIFYYRMKNLITQVEDPADGLLIFRNLGKVASKGVEASWQSFWSTGLETRLSYSFQYAEDLTTRSWLVNSPKHLAKFNLIYPLYRDRLFAGLEVFYASKRKAVDGSYVGDQVITNLTLLGRKFYKDLEVSCSIYNLLGQKYSDPAGEEHLSSGLRGIRQDGRTFRVKLSYTF